MSFNDLSKKTEKLPKSTVGNVSEHPQAIKKPDSEADPKSAKKP